MLDRTEHPRMPSCHHGSLVSTAADETADVTADVTESESGSDVSVHVTLMLLQLNQS